MNAIEVSPEKKLVITFRKLVVNQLTPKGLKNVEELSAYIYKAKGLHFLGSGTAHRQMEDTPDDFYGTKLALGRAMNNAGLNFVERAAIWKHFIKLMPKPAAEELEQARLAKRLRASGDRQFEYMRKRQVLPSVESFAHMVTLLRDQPTVSYDVETP